MSQHLILQHLNETSLVQFSAVAQLYPTLYDFSKLQNIKHQLYLNWVNYHSVRGDLITQNAN